MPPLSQTDLTILAALIVGVAWFLLMRRRAAAEPLTRQQLLELRQRGAVVLDVRTPAEFAQGHPKGARNIPVAQLKARLGELDKDKPVLACCASGMRSGSACGILRKAGFKEVHNLGPWTNLQS